MVTLLEGLEAALARHRMTLDDIEAVSISYKGEPNGCGTYSGRQYVDTAKASLGRTEVNESKGLAYQDGEEIRFYAFTVSRIFFLVEDDEVSGLYIHSIPRNPGQETADYSGRYEYTLTSLVRAEPRV